MQKITYVIILVLTLTLGMVYIQLADYQQITSSLLKDNQEYKNKLEHMQSNKTLLETENQQFQNTIISLEENLALKQLEINNQYIPDINGTQSFPINIEPLNNEEDNSSSTPPLTPNITIDNENEITGFGLEYKQKF